MKRDMTFNEDLKVERNIKGKDGQRYNLFVNGDINAWDINVRDINARDLIARDLNAVDINVMDIIARDFIARDLNAVEINVRDINARDLIAMDLIAKNIDARNIDFYAVAIAYNSFKCKSWKARRGNHVIKCLDGEIEIK